MSLKGAWIVSLAAGWVGFGLTPTAQARGLVLITRGEKITEIADAADGTLARQRFADAKVGYRYEQFGVFWVSIWTWSGEFCVYSDAEATYVPDTPDNISKATLVPVKQIVKPFTYSYPPGALIIGGLVVIGVWSAIKKARSGGAASEFESGAGAGPQAE